MAATLKIPTIFTAVDKISSVVRNMGKNVQGFANKMESGIGAGNRIFRKLTPSIGEAGKQLLSFVSAAAIAGAMISGLTFSTDSLMEYETAVKSFRTIVSDLPDADFSKYEKSIGGVAKKTKMSTIDVAKSYEKIAGLNSSFAKTSEGLAKVSEAAITLSKASGDDLGVSAENLVGIMNQYSMGANEANKAINILAAGQAVGASSITQSAEAYKNYGSVAKSANITLEESQGIIQTLAKFNIMGAEAGTKARGVTLQLQKAGLGYSKGLFNQAEALTTLSGKLGKLKTAKEKDALITKVFGAENITAGKILLGNQLLTQQYTKGVTGTSEASKAAAINSDTMSNAIKEAKNSWVNMITTSDKAKSGMESAKNVMKFVAENMSEIVSVGTKVLIFFAAFKALLLGASAVMAGYNIVLGIQGALSGAASIAIGQSTIALTAYKIATGVVTAWQWLQVASTSAVTSAQWAWNAAMAANPIGLIIIAVGVLIGLVALIISKWDSWGAALSIFLGPLGLVISLIQSFRRNWDMVVAAFQTGGILGGIKAIGRVLLDAILMPVQQLLELLSKIPGLGDLAGAGAKKILEIRQNLGVDTTDGKTKPTLESPDVAQSRATSESIQTQRNTIDMNVTTGTGADVSTKQKGPLNIPIKVTPTNGQR